MHRNRCHCVATLGMYCVIYNPLLLYAFYKTMILTLYFVIVVNTVFLYICVQLLEFLI